MGGFINNALMGANAMDTMAPPGAVAPPNPGIDPVVQMFAQSIAGDASRPPTLAPQGPSMTPGQPNAPATSAAPTGPAVIGNPAHGDQPGLFKRMLMNFAYGGSEALKKHLGLPTDQEVQAQAAQDEMAQSRLKLAQDEEQRKQAADAAKNATVNQTDIAPQLRALGYPIPEGAQFPVEAKQAGPTIQRMLKDYQASQGKQGQLQLNAAKLGYSIDDKTNAITALDPDKLSPIQRNAIDLNNASVGLKKAQTDLAQNPNNPVNRIKFEMAARRMQQADEALRNQEARTGIMAKSLQFRMGQSMMGDTSDPNNSYAQLTPNGQKVLSETAPAKEQIVDLMNKIEAAGLDKKTTPGELLNSRVRYALGFGGPGDELGSEISNLSLAQVIATARAMKGQRGQLIWKEAEKHTPNLWKDSGWQIHNKLGTLLQMLDRTEQAAVTYERKGGVVPVPRQGVANLPMQPRRVAPGQAPAAAPVAPRIRTGGSW